MAEPKIIKPTEAARIFRRLTGHTRVVKTIVTFDLPAYPHLGLWRCRPDSGEPYLAGIKHGSWEYFIKSRLSLGYGSHEIFYLSNIRSLK